ncbi:hypothetical protein GY632_0596 [Trichophyton interdigitale]|uniref:Protein kinase domain-containing protein n=1 Tax=Trichophyton interdigitale TaxID=101480 RepID=A0A9P4YLA0_9EURO|nr:hypothetical protein GY632_0596 [Trichophyton interdigitale]
MRNIASQEPRTAPSGDPAVPKPSMPEPELAEQLNADVRRKYVKDKKLGEGTYAVVYLGHLRDDPTSLIKSDFASFDRKKRSSKGSSLSLACH